MPGDVEYYVGNRNIQGDNQWLSVLSDSIASTITALAGVSGASTVIQFTIGAFTSGATSYATTDVALDIEIIDADGGADNFVQVASLFNVTGLTDEDALETSGHLITV